MQTPLTEYKKNIVSIAQFGGLNHTDLTVPGEWYDMCNLSDRYAPLLAPRRSRPKIDTLKGNAEYIIYKNNLYFYSAQDGIYCYAPQGENPFAGGSGDATVRIYESSDVYDFIEMGNKILCVDKTNNLKHLSIEGDKVIELGSNANYEYRSYAQFDGEGDVREVVAYLNRHNVLYRSMSGDVLKQLTREGNKWYDPAAAELLNICFTYEVEREDGSRYIFGDTKNRYNPSSPPAFADSRYFLGTDNKFYYYNKDSNSAYEVIAPNVAIFIRKGSQSQSPAYPEILAGDYVEFSLGYSMNYNHVTQDYHVYPTKEAALMEKLLLRVNRTIECNEQTGAGWYAQGWEYCIVAEYNAQLIEAISKNNLFQNSASYKELTDYTITDPHADIGRQQIYPRYIKIENPFPTLTAPVEHNNRVWGANNANNEIKSSAQGNYNNWDDYRGLVSDSYTVSVGSDGAFTTSCVIEDYIFFFKEHSYTLIYGTRPANFTTNTVTDFIGISKSGACSLQVIGKSAYFMGIDGKIYRFNGSTSTVISDAIGESKYTPLSSARARERYYLLMADQEGNKQIFVYNTATGVWMIEDAKDIDKLIRIREKACALSAFAKRDGSHSIPCTDILNLDKWEIPKVECNTVKWWCESGLFGLESDYYRYISNLKITFESEVGATVEVFAKFDNDDVYTPLAKFISKRKGTRTEKINIKRCEFMRLKIQGTGFSKIFRISYLTQQGSEK